MNPVAGWGLAVLAIAAGYAGWGWPGVALGITVIVFWLLLQFSRAMRVMRSASQRPVGSVDSAVMLQSRLTAGMSMLQVLPLTRSLGERVGSETEPERWVWRDPAGHAVHTEWRGGKLARWELQRSDTPAA
jgi:uncharacterized protein (DUF58 family)